MNWLRSTGSTLIVGVFVVVIITVVVSVGDFRRTIAGWLGGGPVTVTSTGPTVIQLEKIGLLTLTRVHVADILTAEGAGARGVWLIHGDALLAVDLRRAKIGAKDDQTKSATLIVSLPEVLHPRVNHDRTKTWDVEATGWIPGLNVLFADKDRIRDEAMREAQHLVEFAAKKAEAMQSAKEMCEVVLKNMYGMVGWSIKVEWADPPSTGPSDTEPANDPTSSTNSTQANLPATE